MSQRENPGFDRAEPAFRHIIHADLDAFYASVEQMDNPRLRDKPVLVGGSPESRGVVAACSYPARGFGIHSAMPMRTALRLCPEAIVVRPRFDRYRGVSRQVMDIFQEITDLVEPLSLDEAYLDITEQVPARHSPAETARHIRDRVRSGVGLGISVGVATSKAVAKIASDLEKPDGLVVVEPGTEAEFLNPFPVRKLPGIGPRSEALLAEHGVTTLGQLAACSDGWLTPLFGKRGPELSAMARGNDPRVVAPERIIRSISAENTFEQDVGDLGTLEDELARLCETVARRLAEKGMAGKTVTLKLRLADFTTFTRSTTLTIPLQEAPAIREVARHLLYRELHSNRRFRLLGAGVSNFATAGQLPLLGWDTD